MKDLLLDTLQYKIVDEESFDVFHVTRYELYVRAHQSSLVLGVFDPEQQRCVTIEKYFFANEASENQGLSLDTLKQFWEAHPFLNAAFWKKVYFIQADFHFAFVPESYVMTTQEEQILLRMNAGIDLSETVMERKHIHGTEAKCIFAFNKQLSKWLKHIYPKGNLKISHLAPVFCNSVLNWQKKHVPHDLAIYLTEGYLMVTKVKAGELVFANAFHIENTNDLIYFLLFVMDELGITSNRAKIIVWGEYTEEQYETLDKFIADVKRGPRPKDIKLSYDFGDFPLTAEFDMFSTFMNTSIAQ
ncbi:DUF3822 family protein [Sediminitomix flava]|uniref:Uncharacterized protein DUF3822 n=1 Tax=Sediminitomix flava TaxID=379075 RepID=A0A315ZIK6_SEDFL|nr:DUF3822 family protein [Sediminitomix flava]PWJ44930.1 uncharacterized protein DUF3822 [Sediminitomix flava]